MLLHPCHTLVTHRQDALGQGVIEGATDNRVDNTGVQAEARQGQDRDKGEAETREERGERRQTAFEKAVMLQDALDNASYDKGGVLPSVTSAHVECMMADSKVCLLTLLTLLTDPTNSATYQFY